MDWGVFLQLVILVGLPVAIFVPLELFPQLPVRWLGTFYRKWYKDYMEMSDESIDKLPRLPTDTHMVGIRSHLINRAPEHPEEFPRFIGGVRVFGCIIAAIWLLSIMLLAYGLVTGKLMIVR